MGIDSKVRREPSYVSSYVSYLQGLSLGTHALILLYNFHGFVYFYLNFIM